MFEDSSITASLKRVYNATNFSLKAKYGIDDRDKVGTIMKIHGLDKEHFDFIENTEKAISENLSDTSVDTNANKNEKSVSGIFSEVFTPINKVVGYRYLYRKMKDMYGKQEAKRLSGEMYDMSLAIADSTKILLPYCFSIDASKIVISGRDFGTLPSKPPKRLASYISALNETVHQLSNHLAGALAVGSFFLDVAHVLIFNEKTNYSALDEPATKKYVENCFQNFVHSVNHLSRNSVESPFTNISVFDSEKLKTLLAPDNMRWYFQNEDGEFDEEYVINYIIKLQDIFMDFFDRGDPINNGKPYRFPVVTINISKKTNGEIKILDKKFIEKISHHEIYRYNILVSEGSKVASCCRLLNNFELFELGGQMNSFGGAGISLGSHRVVTINFNRVALEADSEEDYYRILNNRIESASKILEAHRALIKDTIDSGIQPFMKNGWLRLDRMFSTFGILGITEANKTLSQKFHIDTDYVESSLKFLNDKAKEISARTKNIYNIEQIPGETMAVKLCDMDKLIFGADAVPYKLYANQFIPLWEDATIWDRMKVDGKYNQLITGGGICHFSLGEKITPTQAKQIIEFALTSGCEHFALNSVYSECENSHTSFGDMNSCPVCGGQIVEKYTRVVGFFVPLSSWNKTRREWEFPRRHFKGIDE
jgi:ribonucleoside-triphosphate reductase (formate)